MNSGFYPISRGQGWVLLAFAACGVVAFIPSVASILLAGVSLTAWLLLVLMLTVPVVTVLITSKDVD